MNNIERNADIGILYDPARSLEKRSGTGIKKKDPSTESFIKN